MFEHEGEAFNVATDHGGVERGIGDRVLSDGVQVGSLLEESSKGVRLSIMGCQVQWPIPPRRPGRP